MSWNVVWGEWEALCVSRSGSLATVTASTSDEGVVVRGPTADGMQPIVRDAMRGVLRLTLHGKDGSVLLYNVICPTAQVEIGGEPWPDRETWSADVPMLRQPARGVVNLLNRP